jgi:hypothetical protein
MAALVLDAKIERALQLVGGISPEVEALYDTLEKCILAQALENVEVAERRLREVQRLLEPEIEDWPAITRLQ